MCHDLAFADAEQGESEGIEVLLALVVEELVFDGEEFFDGAAAFFRHFLVGEEFLSSYEGFVECFGLELARFLLF